MSRRGLGASPYVWLLDARPQAYEHRKIARTDGDPVVLKRKPDVPTLADALETAIEIHREGWKDAGKSEKIAGVTPGLRHEAARPHAV